MADLSEMRERHERSAATEADTRPLSTRRRTTSVSLHMKSASANSAGVESKWW